MGLVLAREDGQSIVLELPGGDIATVKVWIDWTVPESPRVKCLVDAPEYVRILRHELYGNAV